MNNPPVPPHNTEAEESVLGALFIEPELLPEIAGALRAEDFYIVKNGWVFEAMLAVALRRDPPDLLTVKAELEKRSRLDEMGGPAFLTRLITITPSAYNALAYTRLVSECAIRRRLIAASSETVKLAYDEQEGIESVVDKSNRAFLSASQSNFGAEPSIKELASSAIDNYLNPSAMKDSLLPFGIESVDCSLGGGLERKTQTILMSRPSVGKTAAICQSADANAAAGRVVVFFTLEMAAQQIMDRLSARRARVSLQAQIGRAHV